MKVFIASKLEESVVESVVDGDGIRLTVFFCGCPHHCKECHNQQSWDINNGTPVETQKLANYIKERYTEGFYDGITFSGGDPIFQKEALVEVITLLRKDIPDLNIWCYTGNVYKKISDWEGLKLINVLVDGPYIENKKFPQKRFRGSNNQRILYLENGKITKKD